MDWLQDVISYISKISPVLTLVGILIGIIFNFRRNIIYKISKHVGKGKLLQLFILLDQLMEEDTIDDLLEMIRDFKRGRFLRNSMREAVSSLEGVLKNSDKLAKPKMKEILDDYKERKTISAIKNKKIWDNLRKDVDINKMLTSMVNIINEKHKLHVVKKQRESRRLAKKARKKGKVKKMQGRILHIMNNIPENKAKRLKLEELRKKVKNEQDEKKLREIQQELYQTFNQAK